MWGRISITIPLTKDFIDKYNKHLDFSLMTSNPTFTPELARLYKDRMKYQIYTSPSIDVEYIEENVDKDDWGFWYLMGKNDDLLDDVKNKYAKELNVLPYPVYTKKLHRKCKYKLLPFVYKNVSDYKSMYLTPNVLESFNEWNMISDNITLSQHAIDTHIDKIYWQFYSRRRDLDLEDYIRYQDHIKWEMVSCVITDQFKEILLASDIKEKYKDIMRKYNKEDDFMYKIQMILND